MTRCVVCDRTVRQTQRAVVCEGCGALTHRSCFTGITKAAYQEAVERGGSIPFMCADCVERNLSSAVYSNSGYDSDGCFYDAGSVDHSETASCCETGSDSSSDLDIPDRFMENESIEETERVNNEMDDDESVSSHLELPSIQTNEDGDNPKPDYEIIVNGSSKGKDLLVDCFGFQYTRKPRKSGRTTYWRCVVRNSEINCRATVIEDDGTFMRGIHDHLHDSVSGGAMARKITSKVKDIALANVYQSAASITERIMIDEKCDETACPALPTVANIARAANRCRHQQVPKHPTNLDFELEKKHFPAEQEFLRGDIKIKGQRHIILASDYMMKLLEKADTWYMDGTFKVVKAPFSQLFSIHAFVRNHDDEIIKQVPLCFVIMSARRNRDYKAVLESIRSSMSKRPVVQAVVTDFEEPLWKAVAEVMPGVKHRGCVFHWSQAVWRHIQSTPGMIAQYKRKGKAYRALRLVFALPFLPAENIVAAFSLLRTKLERLGCQDVADYVQSTWIESRRWPPRAWSVFNQTVRTNNDCEGWHFRLNQKAQKANLNFYKLIHLLYDESRMVVINMRLISERRLRSARKKKARTSAARIQNHWDEFSRGSRTVGELLEACAYVYAPRYPEKQKPSEGRTERNERE